MKSFTYKALAVAAASACGAVATAGTLTVPSVRTYAVEAITNNTTVTLPTATLQIGVQRTGAQDFTVIVKPVSAGTRFASCPVPTDANVTASVKRASATECAYEIDVSPSNSAAVIAANTINLAFAGLQFSNHSLATAGINEALTVGVWDLGETARIDNTADLTVTVASSARAIGLSATPDTATVTNVDDAAGPLFGFVAEANTVAVAIADTATLAKANFAITLNSNLVDAAGATVTNAIMANAAVTVSGDFGGLTDVASANTVQVYGAGSNFTTGAGATASNTALSGSSLTFSVAGTQLVAAVANTTTSTPVAVTLKSARNASLGTSRVFGVSAVVNPALTGALTQSLAGSASWWTWGANAMELRSAFFNNDTTNGNITRFFFQNTGAAASYSATCYADDATKTITYGTAKTGTLRQGQTTITAADVCTFSAGQRGAITFTINAPAANVKGVYQQAINGVTAGYLALERPYDQKTY